MRETRESDIPAIPAIYNDAVANTASMRLHAKLGFEECGTVRQVGTKFSRWLDMTLMQLML